jgi:hypothetical protein
MSIQEKLAGEAAASLRRIVAAKGRLQGNFYALVGKNGAGLVVTLAAKDPKGAKAITGGKALKKEIAQSRHVRGKVVFQDNKVEFNLGPGNLSAAKLKLSMKDGFGSNDIKRYTLRAKLAGAGTEDLTDDSTTITEGEQDTAGADDAELNDLIAAQELLDDLNGQLDTFLTKKNDDAALEAIIKSTVDEVEALRAAELQEKDPQKKILIQQQISDSLSEMVEYVQVGEDPFSGGKVPAEVMLLINNANDLISERAANACEAHSARLQPIFAEALKLLQGDGKHQILGAIRDHNLKVPSSAQVDESEAEPVELTYNNIIKSLSLSFLPPNNASLDDGSWQSGFLAYVRSKTAEDAVKAAHQDLLNELGTSADTDRGLDAGTYDTDDPEIYHKTTCGSSWEEVKRQLLGVARDSVAMWQMVLYRKRAVDALLATEKGISGNVLLAKSVGSLNLTSDYDLTLSTTDGSGKELVAIRNFNAAVQANHVNKPPGVVFDTNLYAKDFLKVTDTVLAPGTDDGAGVAAVKRYLILDRSDQDVAALTKMRQYMNAAQWDEYVETMVGEDKDSTILVQLEEADTKYQLKLEAEVTGFLTKYATLPKDSLAPAVVTEIEEFIARREARAGSSDPSVLHVAQHDNEAFIKKMGHDADALMLEIRNAEYIDRMTAVRVLQNQHGDMEEHLKTVIEGSTEALVLVLGEEEPNPTDERLRMLLGEHIPAALVDMLSKTERKRLFDNLRVDGARAVAAFIGRKIDALKEQARRDIGEANYFAAEAYLSEGPLQHIVYGNQSGNPEVLEKLKPEHFLESINEQTGDFLKDILHYESKADDGLTFYQTSKYLHRMLEGILKLSEKDQFIEVEDSLPTLRSMGGARSVMGGIERTLLPIRGAKGEYASASAEKKSTDAARFAERIYGADASTISALRTKVLSISMELNKTVRATIAMRDSAEVASGVSLQT